MANIYEFYGLIRNAVRFFPQSEHSCKRPHTFLVETKDLGGNLNERSLGATICDKDKNYFYSRLWEESGYPAEIQYNFPLVSVFAREATVSKPFSKKPTVTYSFYLNVTDVYKPGTNCAEGCVCGGCDLRTINEINEDTEAILRSILQFIGDSGIYSVDGNEVLMNNKHVDYLVAIGEFPDIQPLRTLEGQFSTINESAAMYHTAPGENLYGTAIRINITFKECSSKTFEFETRDFGQVGADEGCKTCG